VKKTCQTLILMLAVIILAGANRSCGANGADAPDGERLSREQLYALLNEANTTFQQGNAIANNAARAEELYSKAILLYEKIIDQGRVRNAKLYYNLGNAYFLVDDIGRAILNYRRALHLDPSDVNLRNNLAFARSQRLDKVSVETEKRVLETLFFWHYDFSLRTKFLLACLFFAGLGVTATLIVWLGRGPTTTTVAIITAVFWLCLTLSVVVEAGRREAQVLHGRHVRPQRAVLEHDADPAPVRRQL